MSNPLIEYIFLFPEPIAVVNTSGTVIAANNSALLFWQRNILAGESLVNLLQQSKDVVQQWLSLCQGSSQMVLAHFPVRQPKPDCYMIEGMDWAIEGIGVKDKPIILIRIVPKLRQNQQLLVTQLHQLQMELAQQISLVAELQQCQQALEREKQHLQALAKQDCLTGLGNRYFFDAVLNQLWQEAQAQNQALTLGLMDIDDFKVYNDYYGHLAGDRALQQVAQTLKRSLRSNDVVARYGGEEFALVLPQISAAMALKIVERILKHVRELNIPQGKTAHHPYITISAGLCFVPVKEQRPTLTEILMTADAALYQAKQQGRDRCVLLEWPHA